MQNVASIRVSQLVQLANPNNTQLLHGSKFPTQNKIHLHYESGCVHLAVAGLPPLGNMYMLNQHPTHLLIRAEIPIGIHSNEGANREKRKTKSDNNYSNRLTRWIEIDQKSNAFLKPLIQFEGSRIKQLGC